MNCYGITDIGKKRSSNQDCFSVCLPENIPYSCILTVCDGMGGANGGETASRTALDVYTSTLSAELADCDGEGAIKSSLFHGVELANREVYETSLASDELAGMGTTLVSALIPNDKQQLFLVNIGDSRAYLISNDEIKQISHDHSYVQHLVDIGELSQSRAANRHDRNLLTRAVGIEAEALPEIKAVSTEGYTYLLLCSDGLHGAVKDSDIKKLVIGTHGDLRARAEALVALANKKGGNDNVTVILAELDEKDA